MPIITSAQCKSLLQITANTYDTLIAALIPLVQMRVCRYTNNSFTDANIQLNTNTISLTASDFSNPLSLVYGTVLDSSNSFIDSGFASGNDVKVLGTKSNDGIFTASTVASGQLTLSALDNITAETFGDMITITKVVFPQDIQLDVANLINYYITKQGKLVKSESLPGGYSASFKSDEEVYKPFNRYRKPYR